MTSDTQLLERNLDRIEQGAVGLRVLTIVFTVLTILAGVGLTLALVAHGQQGGWDLAALATEALSSAGAVVQLALLAWLSRLTSRALESVAALTRENRGVV